MAEWFVATEREHRPGIRRSLVEHAGRLEIAAPAGPFTLEARADRIDLTTEGGITIIDYKTGAPPTGKAVQEGRAPQLTLEAAIAATGGFPDVPPLPIDGLQYWHLATREPRIVAIKDDGRSDDARLWRRTLDDFKRWVSAFDNEQTAYVAVPGTQRERRPGDYDHLARFDEWLAGEDME